MALNSSNRAPSPMLSRPSPNPNANPNSRTYQEREGIAPARKSFSGYPLGKPSIISQPRSLIPNTPANSPAEYAKRNSFSRDHEQKENERDYSNSKSAARPRSPSILKGSKNFMSPTISAASKINPSPRKKVLGERNEAIRTSASLSDGKFQFFSTSSLEFSDENEPKTAMEHPSTDFDEAPEENVADSNIEGRKIELEPDLVVLSPEVPLNTAKFSSSDQSLPISEMPKTGDGCNVGLDAKNTTNSSPSVIAPLDADPSLRPYDPKTNYLSPRPQFLCYKPNPRIETYINQGLRLEDQFVSESVSETENSEETQSEYSPNEQEDSSSSTEETSPVEEKPPSSESSPTEPQEIQEAAEPKIAPRRRLFNKPKTIAFAFIFLLGLVTFSVTYPPGFGSSTYRDDIVSVVYNDPHVVIDLAKVNINGLFQRAKIWSAHSVSHLSQMIQSLREVREINPVLFSNLTGWQEEKDYVVGDFELGSFFERKDDGGFVVEDFGLISFVEEDGQEETMDTSAENFEELESNPEFEEQEDTLADESNLFMLDDSEPEKVEQDSVLPLDNGEDSPVDVEDLNADSQEEDRTREEADISSVVGFEYRNDAKAEGSSSQDLDFGHAQEDDISRDVEFEFLNYAAKAEGYLSEDPDVQTDEVSSVPLGEEDQSSLNNIETEEMMIEEVKTDSEVVPEITHTSVPLVEDDQSSLNNVETEEMMTEDVKTDSEVVPEVAPTTTTKVSLIVVSVLASAAAIFMYMKPKKANSAISADQLLMKAKPAVEKSVANVKVPSMIQECPPSWSGPVEVDMTSEPCPSEMSSFQKTASHSKRSVRRGADEAQSQSQEERRPKRDYKRESLASSSSEYTMCSSYGSFTTYSIIPSKKGDDEVVTPVRRSSRIRNHVTSP